MPTAVLKDPPEETVGLRRRRKTSVTEPSRIFRRVSTSISMSCAHPVSGPFVFLPSRHSPPACASCSFEYDKSSDDWIQRRASSRYGVRPKTKGRIVNRTTKTALFWVVGFALVASAHADEQWALKPLSSVAPPSTKGDAGTNPIDAFLLAKLEEQNLAFSAPADPRTLIRRLYFDLTGLPPSSEEVEAFVADPSETAYLALIDKLLASSSYGERWGRHWLDIARYGESDGFERNMPRNNLWHFRDWVIRAFNEDMPFDRFARLQIAGDIIENGSHEGLAATGFLVSGVHNTVVGSSPMMKKLAREDELEEIVGALGQTFLGLTVNCARCHDHKFDPISQVEYYGLTAAIGGVYHGERDYRQAVDAKQIAELDKEIKALSVELASIDTRGREKALAARKSGEVRAPEPPKAFATWEFDGDLKDSVGNLHGVGHGGARIENGALVVNGAEAHVITARIPKEIREKTLEAWVVIDGLGQKGGGAITIQTPGGQTFDSIVFAEQENRRWMAGSNGFVRTQSFGGTEEQEADKRPVHVAIVYRADGTIQGFRDGQPYGKPYQKGGLHTYGKDGAEIVFGMRHSPTGNNRMLKGRVLRANFYDRALDPGAVAASAGQVTNWVPEAEIVAQLTKEEAERRQKIATSIADLENKRSSLDRRRAGKIYSVRARNPGKRHLLRRGVWNDVGDAVTPGVVAALTSVSSDLGLDHGSSDADRRRKLAEWVTSKDNPLFPRVAVNRIWHYHFGTGIVSTPSDFGANGGKPTHPELLDWLARKFIESGYRVKKLHRMILTSKAFRQSSRYAAKGFAADADNRLLWRMTPRRIEAEALRDAMLAVAGKLNPKRGGPGYVDVKMNNLNGTMYYTPFDFDKPELNRRTVYRFSPRGQRSALLDSFDCPDPSGAAPRRSVTTTPLQALSLLNNAFVIRLSKHFAARVRESAGDEVDTQVKEAYRLAFAKAPHADDVAPAAELVREHGLESLCRALFNANEFVIVE